MRCERARTSSHCRPFAATVRARATTDETSERVRSTHSFGVGEGAEIYSTLTRSHARATVRSCCCRGGSASPLYIIARS